MRAIAINASHYLVAIVIHIQTQWSCSRHSVDRRTVGVYMSSCDRFHRSCGGQNDKSWTNQWKKWLFEKCIFAANESFAVIQMNYWFSAHYSIMTHLHLSSWETLVNFALNYSYDRQIIRSLSLLIFSGEKAYFSRLTISKKCRAK